MFNRNDGAKTKKTRTENNQPTKSLPFPQAIRVELRGIENIEAVLLVARAGHCH